MILGDGTTDGPNARPGAINMAIDHALLESVQAGGPPTLRFYQWSPACLSFGRNQPAAGVFDPVTARNNGIHFVRRPTGGLAVLHDREITYSVAAPVAWFGGARTTYEAINGILLDALRGIGVPAALAGAEAGAPRPEALHPCFESPSAGEVIAGGGKLVGSAQRCERRTILQHGSILLDGDQSDVACYQMQGKAHSPGAGNEDASSTAVSLRSLLGYVPPTPELVRAFVSAFEAALGTRLAPGPLTETERARAAALETQYDSEQWTWRR